MLCNANRNTRRSVVRYISLKLQDRCKVFSFRGLACRCPRLGNGRNAIGILMLDETMRTRQLHRSNYAFDLSRKLANPGWRGWLLVLLGVALIVATGVGLLVEGPFLWHVQQPQTVQGGLEAILLVAALVASQMFANPRPRLVVAIAVLALYLRRHAIDAPLALDAIYLEVLIALGGFWCLRSAGATTLDYLRSFCVGLTLWSMIAWSASMISFGTVADLRMISGVAVIVAVFRRQRPLFIHLVERFLTLPTADRVVGVLLIGWLAVLCARASYVTGYDSLWYGLRGEYVLDGAGSIYRSMGLVSPVHYFPKLYEVLLLPLSGLGSSSVIIGMTVMMLFVLALTAYEMSKAVMNALPRWRFVVVGACLTIPAIANTSLEAKPDILASALFLLALIHAWEFVRRREVSFAIWACGLLILASQSKLTVLPYAAALTVGVCISLLIEPTRREISVGPKSQLLIALSFTAGTLFVMAMITVRTLLLAGMPTIGPDILFRFWQRLGFELRPPAGTLQWTFPQNWPDIVALLQDVLWQPQRLEHIVITWTGNVWLWLLAFALLLRNRSHPSPHSSMAWLSAPILVAGMALLTCVGYRVRGSDGNYFICALVPAIVLGGAVAHRSAVSSNKLRLLGVCLGAFCLFQASYSFISGEWTPGTRQFDLDFFRSPFGFRRQSDYVLRNSGLGGITNFLRSQKEILHVVGDVPDEVGMRLPAAFEGLDMISYSRPEYLFAPAAFLEYATASQVSYVIWPSEASANAKSAQSYPAIAEALVSRGKPMIEDDKYTLYTLKQPRPYSSAPPGSIP